MNKFSLLKGHVSGTRKHYTIPVKSYIIHTLGDEKRFNQDNF